jgi:hypothetical protein
VSIICIQRGRTDISVVCVSIVSLESLLYLRLRHNTMTINNITIQLTPAVAPEIIPTFASSESVSSSEKQICDN